MFKGKPLQKARGYDAVVIGAGLGGSTLAYRLAQRGMHVLVLEKGDFLQLPPREPGDPVADSVLTSRFRRSQRVP